MAQPLNLTLGISTAPQAMMDADAMPANEWKQLEVQLHSVSFFDRERWREQFFCGPWWLVVIISSDH